MFMKEKSMSQIKTLATQFRTLKSLLEALKEAGVPENAVEVDATLSNKLPLVRFGYGSNAPVQQNALSVRIRKDITGAYEDTGFRFVNGMFEAHISTQART